MPTISAFFGIFIRMYYDDHGPPHFHAYYGGAMAVIEIESLRLMTGDLPPRALAMVLEWGRAHRRELLEDWRLSEVHEPLNKIEPLE